jgi:hypothetical protein
MRTNAMLSRPLAAQAAQAALGARVACHGARGADAGPFVLSGRTGRPAVVSRSCSSSSRALTHSVHGPGSAQEGPVAGVVALRGIRADQVGVVEQPVHLPSVSIGFMAAATDPRSCRCVTASKTISIVLGGHSVEPGQAAQPPSLQIPVCLFGADPI